MQQGITTKYLGPTNSRGSRIKATARKASSMGSEMALTLSRDYSLNTDGDHTRVAKALVEKLGWSGLWIAGGKPEEDGNMYINLGDTDRKGQTVELSGTENVDWFYVP